MQISEWHMSLREKDLWLLPKILRRFRSPQPGGPIAPSAMTVQGAAKLLWAASRAVNVEMVQPTKPVDRGSQLKAVGKEESQAARADDVGGEIA